jgi:hypothetical protein
MKVRKIFIYLLLFCLPFPSWAQYWEVGILLGASNYTGDLSNSPITLKLTKGATGGIIRYNLSPWFTIKTNVYYGSIEGNDKYSKSAENKSRNLSFKSNLLDIGLNGELNLTGYKSGHPVYKNSPYLFFGVSLFRFNPKAIYHYTQISAYDQRLADLEGKWVALQPLCTEGQGSTKYNDREKYNLTQISIPFGVGWKIALSRFWNFGIEIGARTTFTDYLDDVSTTYVEKDVLVASFGDMSYNMSNRTGEVGTHMEYTGQDNRGDPTKKDWYYFAGFTLTYSILPNRCYKF